MKNRWLKNNIGIIIMVVFSSMILWTLMPSASDTEDKNDFNQYFEELRNDNVKLTQIKGDEVTVTLNDEDETILSFFVPENTDFLQIVEKEGFDREDLNLVVETTQPTLFEEFISNFLPLILSIVVIFFIIRGLSGGSRGALSFGRSRAKRAFEEELDEKGQPKKKKRQKFSDVAGLVEAKNDLEEIVGFLKEPKKYNEIGARIPKGVLLVGSPGTGKTLLARAVAGEAGVPFFSISGSEFVEMFVGVGASRVRDMFLQAKKFSPCIIFIDELDAVGRHRGAGIGGGHDEREQTLNQILVEMDGFDPDTNIVIMAATNRPDVLDPALLRPGRFDRQIIVDAADVKGREEILKIHARDKKTQKSIDYRVIAKQTAGFSGADLENLMNEAAIRAVRKGRKFVSQADIEESIDRVIAGPERRSRVVTDEQKKLTAFHEAGHALVGHMLPYADPVHKISIISRGMAAGYTRFLPDSDRRNWSKNQFLDMIASMLAGHAAETLIFGDVSTGASDDLKRSTKIAQRMVMEFGMSEALGVRAFGTDKGEVFLGRDMAVHKDYSEETARRIDDEVSRIMAEAYVRATELLKKYRKKLDAIASLLLEKETVGPEEFEEIVGKKILPKQK